MGKIDRLERETWEEQTSKTVERRSHGRASRKVPRYDGGFIDLADESVKNDATTKDSGNASESKRDETSKKNTEKSTKNRGLKGLRKGKKKSKKGTLGGKPSEEGFFHDPKLTANKAPKKNVKKKEQNNDELILERAEELVFFEDRRGTLEETNKANSGAVNIIEIKSNRVQQIKQKLEKEKLDKANQTKERFENDKLKEEQHLAEKLEKEKIKKEEQVAEKLRREKLEEEKQAAEKLRREKLEERQELKRFRREKLKKERQTAEKLRKEKLEEESQGLEKLQKEKLENEKQAAEKLQKEELEKERQGVEKPRVEELEEKQAAEQLRREKLGEEKQATENLQKEKQEERQARKKRSKEKLSKQEQNREKSIDQQQNRKPVTGKDQNRKEERGNKASALTWEETRPPGSRKNNQRNRNGAQEKQIQGILVPNKTEREVEQPLTKKQLKAAAKQKAKEQKEPRKPMSKRTKRTLGLGIPAALFVSAYIVVSVFYMSRFVDRTYINGYDFSRATPWEVSSFFADKGETFKVEISGLAGLSETITGEELGLSISDNGQVMALLENQNSWAWPIMLLTGTEHQIDLLVEYNDDLLVERVDDIVCIERDRTIEPVDAKPYFNGERFEVRREVLGTLIDPDIVISYIKGSMTAYGNALDLREIGAYIRPNILSDHPGLVASVERLNHYVGSSITYDLNPKLVVVNHEQIVDWLSWDSNFNVIFHEEMAREFMNDFIAKYSTLGTTRTFTNPLGMTAEVDSDFFGWDLDAETEMENFLSNIRNGETVRREPAYFTRGSFQETGEWGDTFIQVCKAEQHLWYFEDGELVLESPIVTGLSGRSQTPTGIFEILWMASPTVLRGPIIDRETGAREWESPVSYWMAITWCGVGLHDATWQPYFGGSRWTYAGSRGCINMPLGLAGELYHMVGEGTITIVHW